MTRPAIQPREITQHHTRRRHGFTGVDQQGFVIGVRGDEIDRAGFAREVFGDGRFEVVVEGAVGGFVEFLESGVSYGETLLGSGGLGVILNMVKLLDQWSRRPSLLNENGWRLYAGWQTRDQGTRRTEVPRAKPP